MPQSPFPLRPGLRYSNLFESLPASLPTNTTERKSRRISPQNALLSSCSDNARAPPPSPSPSPSLWAQDSVAPRRSPLVTVSQSVTEPSRSLVGPALALPRLAFPLSLPPVSVCLTSRPRLVPLQTTTCGYATEPPPPPPLVDRDRLSSTRVAFIHSFNRENTPNAPQRYAMGSRD